MQKETDKKCMKWTLGTDVHPGKFNRIEYILSGSPKSLMVKIVSSAWGSGVSKLALLAGDALKITSMFIIPGGLLPWRAMGKSRLYSNRIFMCSPFVYYKP